MTPPRNDCAHWTQCISIIILYFLRNVRGAAIYLNLASFGAYCLDAVVWGILFGTYIYFLFFFSASRNAIPQLRIAV